MNAPAPTDIGVSIRQRGAALVIELERPQARNALSIAMRDEITRALARFGNDPMIYAVVIKSATPGMFCAGGDVREITALARTDLAAARAGLARELALCWSHECFSKPTVSLIDGPVMGTGVGISLYGTHRVAGERYRFAMPETVIGYFPDCGVLHPLARMPHGIGRYLALTGRAIGPADGLALGLVTHCIGAQAYEAIESHLAEADPIDPLLDDRHRDPGPSPLLAEASRIERYFAEARDVADLLRRLEGAVASDASWAATVATELRARSPMALVLTDTALERARHLDLRETLVQDFRLAHALVASPDTQNGVRVRLVEKSGEPVWQPARIEDVEPAQVQRHFASLGAEELVLPTRAELQAGR
jgi:enoyl-CoA hydratase